MPFITYKINLIKAIINYKVPNLVVLCLVTKYERRKTMTVYIYNNFDVLKEELINLFLGKAEKISRSTNPLVLELHSKYLSKLIANPQRDDVEKKEILAKLLRKEKYKKAFILALSLITSDSEIKKATQKKDLPVTMTFELKGVLTKYDVSVLDSGLNNVKAILVKTPTWQIKVESERRSPHFPFGIKNLMVAKFNRKTRSGYVLFRSIGFLSKIYRSKKTKESKVTPTEIVITSKGFGILFETTRYLYHYKYGRRDSNYFTGVFVKVKDDLSVTFRRYNTKDRFNGEYSRFV